MRISHRLIRGRSGFTLVELMVAAAISISIMVILSEAFTAGIDTFRKLKTIGDQQELLRSASLVLRRDLAAPHFADRAHAWDGPFLSDQRLDLETTSGSGEGVWQPPAKGFFRIIQGSPELPLSVNSLRNPAVGYVSEGLDLENVPSSIARDHLLHFTVRLPGNRKHQLFQASLAGLPARGSVAPATPPPVTPVDAFSGASPQGFLESGVLYTSWAEVMYWMQPTGEVSEGNLQLPLYTLRRRQKLLIDQNGSGGFQPGHPLNMGVVPVVSLPQEISWYVRPDGTVEPNTPDTITVPQRREQMVRAIATYNGATPPGSGPTALTDLLYAPQSGNLLGDDILLTNVISFQVKVNWDPFPGVAGVASTFGDPFSDLPAAGPNGGRNPLFNSWNGPRVFDTWTKLQGPQTAAPFSYDFSRWDSYATPTPPTDGTMLPMRIRVKALQIQIRIWDVKHKATRQVTIVQDV